MPQTITLDTNKPATAYHIVTGAQVFPYAVDALHAISNHPLEWSSSPWTREDANTSRARLNERNKAEGIPALAEPVPLSPEDQKALDEHNKAVADAAARLKAYHERKAKEKSEAEQVAADEALVASTPPQPDPNARKPLSPAQIRKAAAQLSPEEQAVKDRADREAAERAVAEKKAHDEAVAADAERARKAAEAKRNEDRLAGNTQSFTG